MSDLDELCALLDKWEVEYDEEQEAEGTVISLSPKQVKSPVTGRWEQDGNVIGYSGFVCQFSFDLEGTFKHVGIWE
jgi:hypothetical protein